MVLSSYRVGFCVARSVEMGNAKALKCGTSNRTRAFFYVDNINILNIFIMVTFISLLSVLAFVAFIVGMINPSLVLRWNSNPTRLKVFGYYLLVGFVLAFIGAMFSDDNKRDSTSVENAVKDSVETVEENSKSKYIEGVDVKSIGNLFEDKYSFVKDKKTVGATRTLAIAQFGQNSKMVLISDWTLIVVMIKRKLSQSEYQDELLIFKRSLLRQPVCILWLWHH